MCVAVELAAGPVQTDDSLHSTATTQKRNVDNMTTFTLCGCHAGQAPTGSSLQSPATTGERTGASDAATAGSRDGAGPDTAKAKVCCV